jgi:hypothetical protein
MLLALAGNLAPALAGKAALTFAWMVALTSYLLESDQRQETGQRHRHGTCGLVWSNDFGQNK